MSQNPMDYAEEMLEQERATAIAKFQKDSFPTDPILLYELSIAFVDGQSTTMYAVPKRYYELTEGGLPILIFFDTIVGDSIVERAFVGCSVVIKKIVVVSISDIRDTTLMVHDKEMNAVRASRVLRSLPGMDIF